MKMFGWVIKLKNYDARWPFIIAATLISILAILTSGLIGTVYDTQYTIVKARVLSTDDSSLAKEPYIEGMYIGKQPAVIELIGGKHRGEVYDVVNFMSRGFNIHLKPNMVFLCNIREENGEVVGTDVFGYNRDTVIYGLAALFFAILILIGRKKGFYSMISLAFTLIFIIFFLIPRIIEGYNPIFMAMLTAAITTVITIFIVSGCNTKSVSAIAGIVLGVAAAGAISYIAGKIGNISGIHMSEAEEMIYLAQDIPIKVPQLLCAGIIISALGAIMDVGISIASAVFEVSSANPKLTMRELYKSGMNVGRDVMGTMSNTLILAFAGSSMAVLVIIALYQLPYLRLINLNLLDIEFVQGISGSIGLILTVPITAICAAFFASGSGKADGKSKRKKR